jgi:hypothetical protein
MPASSIDTFLACSIMIVLVLSAMAGLSMTVYPYLNGMSQKNDAEQYQQLAEYMLLNPGRPQYWGSMSGVVPSIFGLALAGSLNPYELDIDKVSRLNPENIYCITYPQLLESAGIHDAALTIEIKTLFDLSINLTSTLTGQNVTTYDFAVSTRKSGSPISTTLRCYVVAKNYVQSLNSSTSSEGSRSIGVTIPNSANGTALLVVFAKAQANVMAFNVYPFSHNSSTPKPNGTFMSLSPLNYVLNVSFSYPNEKNLTAKVFTYSNSSNLTQIKSDSQTAQFSFPRLLDSSPMILVITGFNMSSYFAEWVSYPQVPLEMGADMSGSNNGSSVVSLTYIVSINFVLYEFKINFGG